MENIIGNANRLYFLNEGQRKSIEQKAMAHKRYSNIVFEIISANDKELVVQVAQHNHLSENYATADRLKQIGKEVFAQFLYGRKLKVGAKPYDPAPGDVVTTDWIKVKMAQHAFKSVDLEKFFGIDKSTLSKYLSGDRELSRGVKSMFFYFFAYIELGGKVNV